MWVLSDVYYRLEQHDVALRVLDVLSKRAPGDARTELNKGQVYIAKGNHELARKYLEKSIEKKPTNNALAYFELGKILHQHDDMASAKQVLVEAVRQEGTNPEYLHKLGAVCLALNEVEEAIQYLKRAEPAGTTIPEIYYNLGRAYQKQGNLAAAESYMKKFQEISSAQRDKKNRSRESGNLLTLAEEQLDRRNKTEARALLEQVLQADPNNWDAHGYLAEMLLALGDLDLAKQHLMRMEELNRDSVVGNYLMALYWYKNKQYHAASDYAERAKRIQPGNSELRHLLGDIYVGLGRHKEATDEYEAAVRLAPNRSDYRQSLEVLKSRFKTNQEPKTQ
ncbi:MAG: hypothetical protein DMG06_30745 [Acidobacteria bacterium]|nr:MAG: hypothetical protein DMG06_30745 [Acidobacteriota bacterium]